MASVLTNADRARRSLSFGSEQGERPHSLTREVTDLREDVEAAIVRLEGSDYRPEIHTTDLSLKAADNQTDGAGKALRGINFLANRVQATLVIGDLTFTANVPGTGGNEITIEIGTPAGGGSVAVAAKAITITPKAGGDTYANLLTAVLNEAAANKLVSIKDDGGANSATAAVAAQSLSGGTGAGLRVIPFRNDSTGSTAGTDMASLATEITDKLIAFPNDASVGGLALDQDDIVKFVVESHTMRSNPINVTVIA